MVLRPSQQLETNRLIDAEEARIERVFDGGARVAFIAVPTVPHRFAIEPATGDAMRQFDMYLRRQPPHYASPGWRY